MKRNVLVTGCAGGMGTALCRRLSEEGYRVFGLDYKEPENQSNINFIKCDLADAKSVKNAAASVINSLEDGKLYGIIHLAGKYDLNSLVEMSEEDFTGIFNINFFSVYRVNKEFLPLLDKGSRIMMISSELAPLDPLPFTGIYGMTKSAVSRYCHSLRMELQLLEIKVIEVRPGAVKTGLLGVSMKRINDFTEETKYYGNSAKNFKKIASSVEAKCITADALAEKLFRILESKSPRFVYNINRNPMLVLMNFIPDRLQTWLIRKIIE